MVSGTVILVLALLLHLVGLSALLLRRFKVGYYSSIVAGFLAVFVYLTFSYLFVSDNFAFAAVYENSSRWLPLLLKLSASWTGAAGSLLLWLCMMSLAVIIHRLKAGQLMSEQDRVAALVMSIFTVTILVLVLMVSPFSELGSFSPDGQGLNPTLQTLWSVIHPPIIFSAYSAILLSYSLLIGGRWGKDTRGSAENGFRALRVSWILLTLGIALGAAWAYETLGWGGYWAWDPIETSALIPWLLLTAFLFAKPEDPHTDYELFTTTFSASTLLFTVYIARSTQAPSIHGYGYFVGGTVILVLALIPVLISFTTSRRRRFQEPNVISRNSTYPAMTLAFWSLILLASANLILLLYLSFLPLFGRTLYANPNQYNYTSFPFLILFIAAMIAECERENSVLRDVLRVCIPLLAVGVALSLVKWPTGNILANLGLPFLVGLLLAAAHRMFKSAGRRPIRLGRHPTLRYLALFGVAILLLGVFISSSMQSSAVGTLSTGQSISVLDLKILHVNVTTFPSNRTIFLSPYGIVPESIVTKITYSLNGDTEGSRTLLLSYYPAFDQFVPTPVIYSSPTEDLYIVANPTESVKQATVMAFTNRTITTPTDIRVTVSRIPAVSLVWLGVAILVAGNLALVYRPRASESRESPAFCTLKSEVETRLDDCETLFQPAI